MNVKPYIQSIADRKRYPSDAYLQDGLLHCAVCKEPLQYRLKMLGEEMVVPVICRCVEERRSAEEKRARQAQIEQFRRDCFGKSVHIFERFEQDDGIHAEQSELLRSYVERFPEYRRQGKGLLLLGKTGTGKSFFASCIANALIDRGRRVLFLNTGSVASRLSFEEMRGFVDGLSCYDLLILDDLGAERDTSYIQEFIYSLVDGRVSAGLPLLVTSNLTKNQFSDPPDICRQRIYERIMQGCLAVEVPGESRRMKLARENRARMLTELGAAGRGSIL